MNPRHLLAGGLLGLCLTFTWCLTSAWAGEGFLVKDMAGKSHSLTDYKGKWVLVNYWATWCPPCLEEIPDLVGLYDQRKNKDMTVIGIAFGYKSSKEVADFVDDMLMSYPVVLGDEKIIPVFIPGHTAGSMGMFFEVRDNGKKHMAGIFGGAVLLVRAMSGDRDQYVKSIAHYREMAKKLKVDVQLKDHVLTDGEPEKLARIRARKPGEPNPFVVGWASYNRYLDVMNDCFEAQIAARK